MNEQALFDKIESAIKIWLNNEVSQKKDGFGDWEHRSIEESKKFLDPTHKLRKEVLKNFRAKHIFVSDRPYACISLFYSDRSWYVQFIKLLNVISGKRRGGTKEALDVLQLIEETGDVGFLRKYPSPEIGNPLLIKKNGYKFTYRYLRNIYQIGMFVKFLKPQLNENAIVLDIGSSYGTFSSLVKRELPKSRQVLVDLPGQLILAHYYLGHLFPEAKIAGFEECDRAKVIDREFINQYDFVLVPTFLFHKLTAHSVDVVTNFVSFMEMSREWFFRYTNSEVFRTASYVFTVNRYDSRPTYTNSLTFLDFPFNDFEPMHVQTDPCIKCHYSKSRFFFFYERVPYPSQFFQFIGKRKQ